MPEKKPSAFKQLYLDMFKKGGDFSKLAETIPKKKITCYVKESYPYFLVADDFFYVPCYFTQKAVDDFKSKNPSVKIVDLKLRVIELSNWTLEMVKVNSADVFTSYGGLELRLIVKEFNLNQKQGVQRVKPEDLARYPVNIYRDDEVKTLIQSYTHQCLTAAVKSGVKAESLPDVAKFAAKQNVNQGVVKFANGESFSAWQFKEGKTAVVPMENIFKLERGGGKKASQSSAKPKVVGGKVKAGKKLLPKGSAAAIAAQISKHSVAIGKKSKVQKTGSTPRHTPGDKASVSSVGRMTKTSIDKFKSYIKKVKGKK
jgi:hypothetical protein